MIALVDCDGILSNFTAAVLDSYNRKRGTCFTAQDVSQWDIPASLGISAMELYSDVKEGFCSLIPAYEGAKEALDRMREVCDVVCVTAGWDTMPTWDYERRMWLKEHMGFKLNDVIFASGERKALVAGDIFFDDKASTVVSWRKANLCGKGVVFRQPWNMSHETDDYVVTLSHMATVTRVLATGRD